MSRSKKLLITSYVDNEIKDLSKIKLVEKLLEDNPDLKKEFFIQKLTKDLIAEKLRRDTVPPDLRTKILGGLKNG